MRKPLDSPPLLCCIRPEWYTVQFSSEDSQILQQDGHHPFKVSNPNRNIRQEARRLPREAQRLPKPRSCTIRDHVRPLLRIDQNVKTGHAERILSIERIYSYGHKNERQPSAQCKTHVPRLWYQKTPTRIETRGGKLGARQSRENARR